MQLTPSQLNKLADVTLDIGKAIIIAGFASPVINSNLELIVTLRTIIMGYIYWTYQQQL
jgi:hypothetical protein